MEKQFEMPELGTGAIVLITFFVMFVLLFAWGIYTAPTMSEEEEELDRFYDEMYKHKKR